MQQQKQWTYQYNIHTTWTKVIIGYAFINCTTIYHTYYLLYFKDKFRIILFKGYIQLTNNHSIINKNNAIKQSSKNNYIELQTCTNFTTLCHTYMLFY